MKPFIARLRTEMFSLVWLGLVAHVMCVVSAVAQEKPHPLVPALELTRQSLERLQQINDYEATFIKRELINGKLTSQRTHLRLREEPFSVYMKFEEPAPGREVLFVQGRHQNQLLVREASGLASLAGTVSLAIDSPAVMAENRHPITNLGLRNLMKLLIERWEMQSKYGETEVQFYPQAKLGNVDCEVIESSHPQPRRQFPFKMTRLFIEKKSRLPIRIENYGFPAREGEKPPLVEEYTYTNIRLNIGLADRDFDRTNPKYSF